MFKQNGSARTPRTIPADGYTSSPKKSWLISITLLRTTLKKHQKLRCDDQARFPSWRIGAALEGSAQSAGKQTWECSSYVASPHPNTASRNEDDLLGHWTPHGRSCVPERQRRSLGDVKNFGNDIRPTLSDGTRIHVSLFTSGFTLTVQISSASWSCRSPRKVASA